MVRRFFISRFRLRVLIIGMVLAWGLIVARLVEIQIVDSERYEAAAIAQFRGEITIPAERGRIVDSKGRTLATNLVCQSLFAYPRTETEAGDIARTMAPEFGMSRTSLRRKLSGRINSFTWLARKLTEEKVKPVAGQQVPGLFCQQEMKRVYPVSDLGRDLLGAVDIDNKGISGLELAFDQQLRGSNGMTVIERDAFRNIYRLAAANVVKPRNGRNVILTVNFNWQAIVEAELRNGVEEFAAKSGVAVFLRPNDGAVLAMACDDAGLAVKKSVKNEAIADVFEPGSAFKLITAAAALEEGILKPDDLIDCDSGKAEFSGRIINDDKEWGTITFRNSFRVSSNIAMGKIAALMGPRKLFKYAKYFGFGRKTGVDLPGEASGSLNEPEVWSDFFGASLAMGHGISVNALQMAAAFNVVVSDGALYQPYIIRRISSHDGTPTLENQPRKVRTLLSERTCNIMKQFLADVVDSGTAKYARSDLVDFSGKTGTPQKANLENGGYYNDRFLAVFCGYFPRENPVAVGVIMLDNPQPLHYAGMTAAKIFVRIAERITPLEQSGRQATNFATNIHADDVQIPELTGYTFTSAWERLAGLDLNVVRANEGDVITRQWPKGGATLPAGGRLILYLANTDDETEQSPRALVGLAVRDALTRLQQWGYQAELEGHGIVRRVVDLVGSDSGGQKRCRLICSVD